MWSYSCYISQFEKWRQQEIENLFNNAKEGDTQILHSNHGLQSDLCVLNWVFKTSLTVPVDFQREFLKSNSIVAVQERETAVLKELWYSAACWATSEMRHTLYGWYTLFLHFMKIC